MNPPLIKVTSPSFSRNEVLVEELCKRPYRVSLNTHGHRLEGRVLTEFLADADGAIIGLEKVDTALLNQCQLLKIIAKYGVGLDNVDVEACRERGVVVGWTPGINKRSVAEMTIGLMLGLCRNLWPTSQKLRNGIWDKCGGRQLSRTVVGIIGLGNIGQDLVRLLKPFECRVLGNDVLDRERFCRRNGVTLAGKEEIFRSADFVTIHVPLTGLTRHLVSSATLDLMRSDSFLINTSRGGVVDETALKNALKTGRLAGAALDVFEQEPPTDTEMLQLPNLICTPHIAGNAMEAVVAMGRSAIRAIDVFFSHPIRNNVPREIKTASVQSG